MRELLISCLADSAFVISCGGESSQTEKANESLTVEITKVEVVDADNYFQSTDFNIYIGRTISDLLDHIPFKHELSGELDEPPGKLQGVVYGFEHGYEVYVTVADLK